MIVDGKYRRTGIIVNFCDVGFHVRSPGNLSETELDEALDALHNRVKSQENTGLIQLEICERAFKSWVRFRYLIYELFQENRHNFVILASRIAYSSVNDYFVSTDLNDRSDNLKETIQKYFIEDIKPECSKPVSIIPKKGSSNTPFSEVEIPNLISNRKFLIIPPKLEKSPHPEIQSESF